MLNGKSFFGEVGVQRICFCDMARVKENQSFVIVISIV
jgi:hypothetical protein